MRLNYTHADTRNHHVGVGVQPEVNDDNRIKRPGNYARFCTAFLMTPLHGEAPTGLRLLHKAIYATRFASSHKGPNH